MRVFAMFLAMYCLGLPLAWMLFVDESVASDGPSVRVRGTLAFLWPLTSVVVAVLGLYEWWKDRAAQEGDKDGK